LRSSLPSEGPQALTDDVEQSSRTRRQDDPALVRMAAEACDELARALLEVPSERRDFAPIRR
jgi:hypothetical protein